MTSSDSPVFVYQCIEGHAIPPASGEIVDVDIGVPAKRESTRAKPQNYQTKAYALAKWEKKIGLCSL